LISRRHIIGVALAAGLMFSGGAGLAVADTTPTTTAAPTTTTAAPAPATSQPPAITAIPVPSTCIGSLDAKLTPTQIAAIKAKCAASGLRQIDVLPKGAPETGGGGMAAEVSSWG
jgi:hypothetical protein